MAAVTLLAEPTGLAALTRTSPSARARQRFLDREGAPSLGSDWLRAVFLHYRVDPDALQPLVPFPLDLRRGEAYVSLVAFTMQDLHLRFGGAWGRRVMAPLASHPLLNVRTYVRVEDEPGIYFLAEWIPNALAARLGPPLFGLPYRLGNLDYRHLHETGTLEGYVAAADAPGPLIYEGALPYDAELGPAERGSLTEFLLERYTAYTAWHGLRRCFRIWHPPWPQTAFDGEVLDDALLDATGGWMQKADFIGATYSPGVRDVWMGRPRLG
ncbi:MAG: DUF2071 domain-containing protein [Rhodothermaceae bacterium]|nr:DUF2071 domain-containing protein [Rhodothermaceae bacterium]